MPINLKMWEMLLFYINITYWNWIKREISLSFFTLHGQSVVEHLLVIKRPSLSEFIEHSVKHSYGRYF